MKLLMAITVLMLLGGCQNQMQRGNGSAVAIPNPGVACYSELTYRPEFSAIANKVALDDPTKQTLEMLSNTTRASDGEKTALAAWVRAKQQCNDLTRHWRTQINMPGQLVAISENVMSTFMVLTADLYNSKYTYGEYAKARAESGSKFQRQWADAVQNLQQQQADAQEQNKNRALMYLLNQPRPAPLQVPAIAPIQRPTHTNCYVIGNQMNCTTQ
jgi:hypothetical protein